ncbi:MAG: thioredoxin family protein [Candidatus Thorarchaeota archaeon]|nr:thioredoxin family protein [Candidatus Thorarchaeota archaeon]
MVRDVSPEEAKQAMVETTLLFLDAWAPWCGPCLALGPLFEELEEKYSSNPDIGFIKLNTQEHKSFAAENNIAAIPCILVYHNGKPASFEMPDPRSGKNVKTDSLIGMRPIEHYESVIEQLK